MKKVIIKLIMLFAVYFAAVQFTQAQTVKQFRQLPIEQKAHLVTDSLKTILNLSGDQYSKTYTIILDAVTKARDVAHSYDSRVTKGQKLKALLAEEEAKIKFVLSPAQYALYQTKKQSAIAYYRQRLQNEKLVFNTPN